VFSASSGDQVSFYTTVGVAGDGINKLNSDFDRVS
jgi:hypothetical protein